MYSSDVEKRLRDLLAERIVILDGAMGTQIQDYKLDEEAFRGERYREHAHNLKGNIDILVLTAPDKIKAVHRGFLDAGADILETSTFSANRISQADYGLENDVYELNKTAAELAVSARQEHVEDKGERPVFVAGGIG